jgi:hypothetical protein
MTLGTMTQENNYLVPDSYGSTVPERRAAEQDLAVAQ